MIEAAEFTVDKVELLHDTCVIYPNDFLSYIYKNINDLHTPNIYGPFPYDINAYNKDVVKLNSLCSMCLRTTYTTIWKSLPVIPICETCYMSSIFIFPSIEYYRVQYLVALTKEIFRTKKDSFDIRNLTIKIRKRGEQDNASKKEGK